MTGLNGSLKHDSQPLNDVPVLVRVVTAFFDRKGSRVVWVIGVAGVAPDARSARNLLCVALVAEFEIVVAELDLFELH